MARPIRVEFNEAIYHVTARGNERQAVFRDDRDRKVFLETLAEGVERFGLRLLVYCLMGNHYHLVVGTPEGNLSRAIGWLQTTYTIRFNRRHRRSGHLFQGRFQGRFKALLVEADEYARRLIEYIHLNPVRMGIKRGRPIPRERETPLDAYAWSSHRAYAGLEKKIPAWLDDGWMSYYGRNRREAQKEYRRAIRGCLGIEFRCPWDDVWRGVTLGGEEMREKVSRWLKKRSGADERRWQQEEVKARRREWVRAAVSTERDKAVRMWMRVALGRGTAGGRGKRRRICERGRGLCCFETAADESREGSIAAAKAGSVETSSSVECRELTPFIRFVIPALQVYAARFDADFF